MLNPMYEAEYQVPVIEAQPAVEGLAEESKDLIGVSCLLADIRSSEIKGIINRVTDLIRLIKLDPKILQRFESILVQPGVDVAIRELLYARFVYNDMMGVMDAAEAHSVKTWQRDQLKNAAELERIRDVRNRWLRYLGGQVRRQLAGYKPVMRAAICKAAGMYSKDALREDGGSSFSMNVLPEESLLMNTEWFGAIDWAGEELFIQQRGILVSGQFYWFEDGIEEDHVCRSLGEPLTGEYEVLQYNGRWYAVERIKELVIVPEPTQLAMVRLHPSQVPNFPAIMNDLTSDAPMYVVANKIEGDQLVIGANRYALNLPAGSSWVSKELDYATVRFVEALKGQVEFHGEDQQARKESVVLLCLEITGHQEHEEIKPIKLQSAAQRKANPVVQEALFDEGL